MVLDIFGTYKGPSFRAPHFYTPSNKPPIDYLATMGAALRQENFAISGLNRFSQWLVNTTHPEEKEYDAWRDIRGTRYEDHALLFASSRSKADTLAIMAAIDREIADKKLLYDAGAFGLISSLIAGTIDPINLIPLGGALTKISRIPSIFKRVPLGLGAGIGTGAVGAAAQELGLYATQLTRTPEEVQMGISGGALLGGLLGGAASFLHVPIDVAGNRVLMDWEGRPLWHVKTDIVRKTGMYSRDEFRADLIHEWALPAEQVDAALAAFEATAVRRWAELNNKTIDDWYAEHLGQAVAYSESELQAQIKLGKRSNRLVSQMNIEPDELARKILSQSEGELFRGASVFDFRNDGKAILVALRGAADITTVLHELAHVQRKTLLPSEIKVLEHYLGVKDGKWTRAAEEKYVELVEQRIREKKWAEGAPDAVKPVLEKFVQWIMDVWTRLRETPLAEEIHPQVKRIIEKYWVPYKESLPVPSPSRELFTEEGELIPFQKLPREAEYAQEQLRKLFDAVEKRGTDVLFQKDEKSPADSTVDSLDIQPIPFVPDFALKFMAKISPGSRLFTSKYSKAGARLAEQLINVSFYLGRHWNGESTQAPPVEILVKKKIGSYFSEASKSVNDAFVKYRARIAGEKIPDRATIGKYVGLRTKDFIQQKILREQGIMDMDSFKRLVFDAWGGKKIEIPEVMEAARVRRELMDRLGKELSDAGLLTPELKELLNQGVGHRPRIYNIWAIEKYNRHFREIVKTQAAAAGLKVPGTGDLDEILDDIVRTHTGFLWFETRVDINNLDNLEGEQAKFLHKRFFNFSDEHLLNVEIKDKDGNVVDVVDFIQTDPDRVLLTYLNAVIPDLELKKRFGSIDLIKQFKEISKDYNDKIDAAEGLTDDITNERKAVLRDLLALRDRLRGVDRIVGDPRDPIRRGYNAIQRLNGTLYLGNVLLSSLADPGRAVMRYGLQPFKKALSSALANPELWQQFKGWERSIGAAVDVLTTPNSRWLEFADLTHPYQGKNMVERGIGFLSDQFGLMTGLDIWTSQWKALTGLITSHWILDAALILQKELDEGKITLAENGAIDVTGGMSILGQKRIQTLAQMNLNARELVEIAREFKKYGDSENPDLWLPHTNEWQNKAIRDKFESAIIQEMENTIVTPDIGDRPLIAGETGALGPLGPLMTQFWSFTFASMQKVIMSGLQQRDKAVLQGVLAMTFLGGVSYVAKQLARGETPTTDPDEFLLEAIDNAGLLGIFSNINGFIEQLSKGNFGLHPLVGEGVMSRYQYRGWTDILLGASASTIKNLARVASVPFSWDIEEREINSAFNLIPYSRLWYWRWIFEHLRENSVDMLTPTGTE